MQKATIIQSQNKNISKQQTRTFSRTGNYAYDATNAYTQEVMGLLEPEIAKKLVNEAIQYYYPKRNISYENHKKYCEVLGLRINMSMNNPQQLPKDLYDFNLTCK